ncbi:MAG: DUF4338 domain-containing protein, partial [Planctomycetota bacterium]|nr:DUF4338 domain-containing protein [Planctomycetota bacterium]
PRDRFIGWSGQGRRQNIRFLAYNTRFLILPWVEVPNLASHLLGRMANPHRSPSQGSELGHGLIAVRSGDQPKWGCNQRKDRRVDRLEPEFLGAPGHEMTRHSPGVIESRDA